jgi:hypothetical protein
MAGLHDHVVPVADACVVYHLLGSPNKQLVLFPRSAHVLLKDYDRQAVLARVVAFIQLQASRPRYRLEVGIFPGPGQMVIRELRVAVMFLQVE